MKGRRNYGIKAAGTNSFVDDKGRESGVGSQESGVGSQGSAKSKGYQTELSSKTGRLTFCRCIRTKEKDLWLWGCFPGSISVKLKDILDYFPHDEFECFIQAMLDAYHSERKIFVMGNGGSASTASHWVCDINKGCCLNLEKKFKMICLNDSISTMLAYSNDLGYEDIFVEQLKNFFEPGDLVIGISGSGNSENVVKAIEYARDNSGKTVGLVGFTGGRLAQLVDILLWAKVEDMQKVEDIHMIIAHMSMQKIANKLNNENF